jgi:hypothetical protein
MTEKAVTESKIVGSTWIGGNGWEKESGARLWHPRCRCPHCNSQLLHFILEIILPRSSYKILTEGVKIQVGRLECYRKTGEKVSEACSDQVPRWQWSIDNLKSMYRPPCMLARLAQARPLLVSWVDSLVLMLVIEYTLRKDAHQLTSPTCSHIYRIKTHCIVLFISVYIYRG